MDQDKLFFSHDFLTRFIQEYRKYPSLWDPNVKEYVNNVERQKSWEQLLMFCETELGGVDLEWLKRKVHSMKGSFNKELKKMKEARRAGFQGEWQPKLWYYEHLLFTKSHDLQKHTVKKEFEEDGSQTGSVVQNGDRYGEEEINVNGWAGHLLEEETNSTADDDREMYSEAKDAEAAPPKRKASPTGYGNVRKRRVPQEIFHDEPRRTADGDVYDAVGKVVANKLRALADLDYTQFIRAEKLINDALYRGFQKRLNEDCDITFDRQPVYSNHPTMTASSSSATQLPHPTFPHHTYNYYFPLNSPLPSVPFQSPPSTTAHTPSKSSSSNNHHPVIVNRSPTQITCEVDVMPQ